MRVMVEEYNISTVHTSNVHLLYKTLGVPQGTKELLPKHNSLKITRLRGPYHNNILICALIGFDVYRSDNEVEQLRVLTPAGGVRRTVLEPADLQQRAVRRRHTQLRNFRDRLQRVQSSVQTPPERETAQRAEQRRWWWRRHYRQQQPVDGLVEQVGAERKQQPQQPVEQRLVRELEERGDLRVGERGQVLGQQVRATDETREDTVRRPHKEVLGRGAVVHHVRVQRRKGVETLSGRPPRRIHGQGRGGRRQPEQGLGVRSRVPGQEDLPGIITSIFITCIMVLLLLLLL